MIEIAKFSEKAKKSKTVRIHDKIWYFRLKPNNKCKSLMESYQGFELDTKLVICYTPRNLPSKSTPFINKKGNPGRLYALFKDYIEFNRYLLNIPVEDRCFYEVILGSRQQKPHFDIDIDIGVFKEVYRGKDPLSVREEILSNIILICHNVLRKHKINLNINTDVLIYNSDGEYKLSNHIVLNNVCHSNNKEAKAFYDEIISGFNELTQGDYTEYIDGSVYSSLQQFRTLNSCKSGTNRVKTLNRTFNYRDIIYEHFYKESIDSEAMMLSIDMSESLLTFCSGCTVLPSMIPKIKTKEYKGQDIDDVIEQKCLDLLEVFYPDHPFTVRDYTGGYINLERSHPSFCPTCKVEHQADGALMYVRDDIVFWKCRRAVHYAKGKREKLGSITAFVDIGAEKTVSPVTSPHLIEKGYFTGVYNQLSTDTRDETTTQLSNHKPQATTQISNFEAQVVDSTASSYVPTVFFRGTVKKLVEELEEAVLDTLKKKSDNEFLKHIENGGGSLVYSNNVSIEDPDLDNLEPKTRLSVMNRIKNSVKDYIDARLFEIKATKIVSPNKPTTQVVSDESQIRAHIDQGEVFNIGQYLLRVKHDIRPRLEKIHLQEIKITEKKKRDLDAIKKRIARQFSESIDGDNIEKLTSHINEDKRIKENFSFQPYYTMNYCIDNYDYDEHMTKSLSLLNDASEALKVGAAHQQIAEFILHTEFSPMLDHAYVFQSSINGKYYYYTYDDKLWLATNKSSLIHYTYQRITRLLGLIVDSLKNQPRTQKNHDDLEELTDSIFQLKMRLSSSAQRTSVWKLLKMSIESEHIDEPVHNSHLDNCAVQIEQHNIFRGIEAKIVPFLDECGKLDWRLALFLDHIKNILCDGDQERYNYLMTCFIQGVRHFRRSEVCNLFIGKKGSGKSLPFLILMKFVYGLRLVWLANDFEDVLDNFNAQMDGKLIVVVDDAKQSGKQIGKNLIGRFNSLVTGETLDINQKHIKKKTVMNILNFFGFSNFRCPIPLTQDERRIVIHMVSNAKVGDIAYFRELANACCNQDFGDIFYSFLMSPNANKFLVPLLPVLITEGMDEIMELCKSDVERFVDDCFKYGLINIPAEIVGMSTDGTVIIDKCGLWMVFKEWFTSEYNGKHTIKVPCTKIFSTDIVAHPSGHFRKTQGRPYMPNGSRPICIDVLAFRDTALIEKTIPNGKETFTLSEYISQLKLSRKNR